MERIQTVIEANIVGSLIQRLLTTDISFIVSMKTLLVNNHLGHLQLQLYVLIYVFFQPFLQILLLRALNNIATGNDQ